MEASPFTTWALLSTLEVNWSSWHCVLVFLKPPSHNSIPSYFVCFPISFEGFLRWCWPIHQLIQSLTGNCSNSSNKFYAKVFPLFLRSGSKNSYFLRQTNGKNEIVNANENLISTNLLIFSSAEMKKKHNSFYFLSMIWIEFRFVTDAFPNNSTVLNYTIISSLWRRMYISFTKKIVTSRRSIRRPHIPLG